MKTCRAVITAGQQSSVDRRRGLQFSTQQPTDESPCLPRLASSKASPTGSMVANHLPPASVQNVDRPATCALCATLFTDPV